MTARRPLDEMKAEFEGQFYSRGKACLITKEGYGFTVRFGTGKISKVYQPVKPSVVFKK